MESYRRVLAAVSAALILSAAALLAMSNTESYETINCINQSQTCEVVEIDRRPSSCQPWAPWDRLSALECNYTSEDVSQVSLITDQANYIDEPMTNSDYTVETFNNTGNVPWGLEILPSGERLWTNRNSGKLKRTINDRVYTLKDFDVYTPNYNGLMGLALDPNFEETRRIYLFKTDRKEENNASIGPERTIINQILRFKLENTTLENRTLLFETAGGKNNAGGRIVFGPDGKMYLSSMEPTMYSDIENHRLPGSYILRANQDGSIPEDNPFNDSRIYSMGHRNPQGLAFKPETGELYSSEHGPWRHDEINRILPGKNYGWQGYRCDEKLTEKSKHGADPENYNSVLPNTEPEFCFDDWSMAPSGMVFVNDTSSPWHGDLFVAGLRGHQIHRFIFENGEIVENEVFYVSNDEKELSLRMRDVEYFNGSLYALADQRGGMVKITPEN